MLHRVSKIRGATVLASDGDVGHVEEFLFEDTTWRIRYLIVNAAGRKVLVSPDLVKRNWGIAGLNVALTRQQVSESPGVDDVDASTTSRVCRTSDVTGDHIQASDGEIGHVDDFLIDEASWTIQYFVVDTSNWIGGKSVLISPTVLKGIDWSNSTLQVSLTREAIKNSPSIDSVTIAPGENTPFIWIM
jgi:sporulation protein YlmC with PRC-barrel domain